MNVSGKIKAFIVIVVSYSTALLFVYAAVSKLIDFENFQVQLGQSPLLSAFASYISFAVPIIEILLAVLLSIPFYRLTALKASYLLMVVFTTYIYVILHYSAYVPCSCGGVLEKMSWNQHLLFNIFFLLLIVLAIFMSNLQTLKQSKLWYRSTIALRLYWFFLITFIGIVMVVALFHWSEQLIQYSNSLTRKMPPHAAQLQKQFDLKVNSYYFAGAIGSKIYLGNSTAPLLVTEIDTALSSITTHKILPDDKTLPFQAPTIRVFNNNFFLYEGNIPYVFRGNIRDWNAVLMSFSGSYFSYLEPMDENHVAVRFIAPHTGKSILGTIDLSRGKEYKAEDLLERQLDGIFDVDGSLHYDAKEQKIIYVYRYRNQFIVADKKGVLDYRGNTIDTISKAQITITEIESKKVNTFSTPPLIVNKMSAVYRGLLFVNSTIQGKYESTALWKEASIIDIYNLNDHSYLASFPIYNLGTFKMQSFIVVGDKVYVLIQNQIVCYRLYDHLFAQTNYDK